MRLNGHTATDGASPRLHAGTDVAGLRIRRRDYDIPDLVRVARGHRGFPTATQPAPELRPRRQDPEERDPKRVRFTAATSDHTPGNEAAPRGRADLQALALSHPRWAAATARGRAAPSIVSAVRAHGGGLRAIAAKSVTRLHARMAASANSSATTPGPGTQSSSFSNSSASGSSTASAAARTRLYPPISEGC